MTAGNCPCRGDTLDKLIQPAILTLLAKEPMHGYALADQMELLRGERPDLAGVYRFLASMQKRSLVVSEWESVECGPNRKIYRITDAGRECLECWVAALEQHARDVRTLLRDAKRSLAKLPAKTPTLQPGSRRGVAV